MKRVLPGCVIDHDCVAVVDDAEWDEFVSEFELRKIGDLVRG